MRLKAVSEVMFERSSVPPGAITTGVLAKPRWVVAPMRTVPPWMLRPLAKVALPEAAAISGWLRVTLPEPTEAMVEPGAMPVPETTMPAMSPVVLASGSSVSPAALPTRMPTPVTNLP